MRRKRIALYEMDGLLTRENLDIKGSGFSFPFLKQRDICVMIDENLTKTQKSYIMLYYSENKTVVEIARMFGVNKSTVSRTINRAKANLYKVLGGFAS